MDVCFIAIIAVYKLVLMSNMENAFMYYQLMTL